MKRIIVFALLLASVIACKKDEVRVVVDSDATPPVIANPTSSFNKVITAENLSDTLTIAWSQTGYGVATQVNYQVELDSRCGTFTTPTVIGTVVAPSLPMSLGDLNNKLINSLKLAQHVETQVQIRVTSNISGSQRVVSEPVTITVTPYSDKPVALWLGENSASAPVLYATSDHTFEGYRVIEAGTSFRFSASPTCSDIVYGSGGAGKLAVGETTPEITMPRGGFYKFNLNTETLTLDTLYIATWGLIGSSTSLGWDGSTAMNYNADNGHWEGVVSLNNGALKFRANNNWDLNYGPADINSMTGTLITTNDAIDIKMPDTYLVSIDFTQATAPYHYTYSVTKSSAIPEPLKLWLPGGYQDYKPDLAPTIYAISGSVYEGYVYIPSGTGFKFTSAPDWVHTNYGDAGVANKLSTDGAAPDLSLPSPGYWKLKADVTNLSYETILVNTWGLIGTSTVGQWDNSTAMTYDQENDVWTITTHLMPGALKFRANNGWDLNYGPAVIADYLGALVQTNDSINIQEEGDYTVTLDFSRSGAPYQYSYKVVKN